MYFLLSDWGYCKMYECCRERWIRHDPFNMDVSFHKKLFGQHLAMHAVYKTIYQHVNNENPEKALVLAFHGSTGTGKNFVSEIVISHLYYMGSTSKFVVKKILGHDYPHADSIYEYKKGIKNLIQNQARICDRSIFIFDEMDKMPAGLIDGLKPYLDNYSEIEGLNYRKNIFIFLSNLGAEEINNETYNHLKSGKIREEVTNHQMQVVLQEAISNETGGLKDTVLMSAGLIDVFVPFLPLEKKHIKQCIQVSIKERRKLKPKNKRKPITNELKEAIANELHYWKKIDVMFSESGCKMVAKKVALHI